jgi:hypothetical protein
MANVKIDLDFAGIGEVLTSGGVRSALNDIAEKAAARARSTAPVGETGEYRGSIRVESDTWRRGPFQYAIERVVADDDKAMAIESRTGNLKRALK